MHTYTSTILCTISCANVFHVYMRLLIHYFRTHRAQSLQYSFKICQMAGYNGNHETRALYTIKISLRASASGRNHRVRAAEMT